MIVIVIPAFNEDLYVLNETLRGWAAPDRLIVLVDDGSEPKMTLPAEIPGQAFLLRHPENKGQGAAIRTGLEFAVAKGAAYILTVDADGQHDPANFPHLIFPLINDEADIVFGSRFLEAKYWHKIPVSRRWLLRMATYFNNYITGLKMTDAHNGLRAMNRRAAKAIRVTEDRMAHASEIPILVGQAKLRWREVAVEIHYTDYSVRKGQSLWRILPLLYELLKLRNRFA